MELLFYFEEKSLLVELLKQLFNAREGLEQMNVDKLKPAGDFDMETA